MTPPQQFLANYIKFKIRECGRTQVEIAAICGFKRPQMISMMKQGKCGVPVAKVGALAKALNVDPIEMALVVLAGQEPELWSILRETFEYKFSEGRRRADNPANFPDVSKIRLAHCS